MSKKKRLLMEIAIGTVFTTAIPLIFYLLSYTPSGNDIWGHVFKTEFLYDQIKQGTLYPLYSGDWYNGIQLYRYWPIFTYYVTAGLTFLTGNVITTYYLFLGLSFAIGYTGWCLIANREEKMSFVMIGVMWWFMPDNIRIAFSEGNLARVMTCALIPIFLYCFTDLIENRKKFVPTVLCVFLLTNTHFMITAMCAVIFCIYGFFRGLKKKTWYLGFTAFICGLLLSGITLIPGIVGGIVSDKNSSSVGTSADWAQDLFKSLFYPDRNFVSCVFGLFALFAAISVLIKGKGKRSGTIIGLIFFILSDSMFVPILMQFPLSQVWWMARFISMCYALILYEFGFLDFKEKPKLILFLILAFIIDAVPSYTSFVRKDETDLSHVMFDKAVDSTDNVLGVLDESLFGPYLSYASYKKAPYLQGWAIQGASIKDNIVVATESLKLGYYGYTFKNALQLGCDSLVINKCLLPGAFYKDVFLKWASDYGYELVGETSEAYLFDNKLVNGTYGTVFEYDGLAIGSSSEYVCYLYPSFLKGESDDLDDYPLEELLNYKKVYLSNFQFSDYEKAQEKMKALSDAGVSVYIDSTHLPINYMDISELFGIEARFINTKGSFNLNYGGRTCHVEIPYEWNATYLATDDESVALYSSDGIGYLAKKDNITILGLNLLYVNIEDPQEETKYFIDGIFEMESKAPSFEIIPVSYEQEKSSIVVNVEKSCMTTLAFQDNFKGNITEANNLVMVGAGVTKIDIYYKHFRLGLFVSLLGAAATTVCLCLIIRKKRHEY